VVVAIIACEIGFWVLLALGLLARYVLKARRLSAVLLISVPVVDVVLLAISVIDLRRGGEAGLVHSLAAIYIGVSIAFGHQLVSWADQRVAHRFAGGPPPVRPPRSGRAHAVHQVKQWLRHLLAYLVAAAVLGGFTLLVGDLDRTLALWAPMAGWGVGVLVDLVITVSYAVSPRKAAPGR